MKIHCDKYYKVVYKMLKEPGEVREKFCGENGKISKKRRLLFRALEDELGFMQAFMMRCGIPD